MPRFRPILDQVLIRRDSPDEMTNSGIIVPKEAQEKRMTGVVVAVGDGVERADGTERQLRVRVNQRVFFKKFAGTELLKGMLDEHEYCLVAESDVMGILLGDNEPDIHG